MRDGVIRQTSLVHPSIQRPSHLSSEDSNETHINAQITGTLWRTLELSPSCRQALASVGKSKSKASHEAMDGWSMVSQPLIQYWLAPQMASLNGIVV